MTRKRLAMVAVVLVAVGAVAFVSSQAPQTPPAEAGADSAAAAEGAVQPIAFPHDIHAGENQIDCQYCHFSAERSVDAGIPPVSSCMGCHLIIPGTQNPEEVQKLRDFWQRREAIPWVRIYKVPDHVHFPHLRHVAAGVECQQCHGQVEEMAVIEEVAQPLEMGWCVSCHQQEQASLDCAVCHY